MLIKNTNERFGICGTFEATSVDEVVAEMDEQIVIWAKEEVARRADEAANCELDPDEPEDASTFQDVYRQLRAEFRAGLVVVEPAGVEIDPGWE